MNSTALGALLSTGVNGIPPRTATSERFQTGYAPGAPVSAPPRMKAGFLSAIWPAQRPEGDGWPSVAHVSSFTRRPPTPPLPRPPADAALVVIDVLDRGLGGLAVLGERHRTGLDVEQADHDRVAAGLLRRAERRGGVRGGCARGGLVLAR